ncbi:MAG: hypothetical protein EA422_09595 [Gemmatimonadales bacterium]|nr:MAG: hypothetical protein EA422_09595 [Gemmatimonadales bacterium]
MGMEVVREFRDLEGRRWRAGFTYGESLDYQGRYHLTFESGEDDATAELRDVRWNSEHTARLRLESFSDVELRRRLRSALGRSVGVPGS